MTPECTVRLGLKISILYLYILRHYFPYPIYTEFPASKGYTCVTLKHIEPSLLYFYHIYYNITYE